MDITYKTSRGEKTYIVSTFEYSFSCGGTGSIRSNVTTDKPIDAFLLRVVRDAETVETVVRFQKHIDGKVEDNEIHLKGVQIYAITNNASGEDNASIHATRTLILKAQSLVIDGVEVLVKKERDPSGGFFYR